MSRPHTSAPTVRPAAIEGIEPVRMNPIVPPVAVRAPRTKAVWSRDCGIASSAQVVSTVIGRG